MVFLRRRHLLATAAALSLLSSPASDVFASGGVLNTSRDLSNIIKPAARRNVLYTPAICDGVSATDGTVASGSNVLTSASAQFQTGQYPLYQGETISVAMAAATRSAQSAAVAAGGSGYQGAELLTLTDGTVLQVLEAPGGVVTKVKVYTRVSEAAPPTNPVSQASTNGAGTGATFNLTFIHDNLVTTVASVDSDNQLHMTASNGAGADVASAPYGAGTLNDAQVSAELASTGEVQLPRGKCAFGSTITLAGGQSLFGRGAGQGSRGTSLMYLGTPNGTQLAVGNGSAQSGLHFGDFQLDGDGSAFYGARLIGMTDSHILPITATRVTGAAFVVDSYGAESQYSKFDMLQAYLNSDVSAYADGLIIGMVHNTNHHKFVAVNIQHRFGRGIVFAAADSNSIDKDTEQQVGGGDGLSVVFEGSGPGPRGKSYGNTLFDTDDLGGGHIYGAASGYVLPSTGNRIRVNSFNGATVPTRDADADFECSTTSGGNCAGTGIAGKLTFYRRVIAKTGDYALVTTDAGTLFTNAGAVAANIFTLPPATGSGLPACFRRISSSAITIQTSGTDKIALSPTSTNNATGYLKSAALRASMCVVDDDTAFGTWRVMDATGTWSNDAGDYEQFGLVVDANGLLQTNGDKVSTAQLDKTSNTTFAVVPGLQVSLAAGKTYSCRGHLTVIASGAGGIKVTLQTADTLTATSISFTGRNYNGTTFNAQSTATALNTAVAGAGVAVTDVYIDGAIVVNVAGSIQLRAAQFASNATTTSVGINSTFSCKLAN